MRNRFTVLTILLSGAVAVLAFMGTGQAGSSSASPVLVTNFPDPQTITGEVAISGPVRLSKMKHISEILVPPVAPRETTRLVEGGTIETDGFASVVLSLHGQVKGSVQNPGEVGVILVPDERTIQQAFNEQGLFHFSLRAAAHGVSNTTPWFASDQPRYTVGFGTYRVLFYNTTDKTVTVDLFAYLTS
jgi:hypothetical protein